MDFKLEDIVDISLFQVLQDKLNVIYSFPSAIIDNEGKILTAVAWQDICTKFHRMNPECEKECIKSDKYIIEHLKEANPAVSYKCPHGLIDNATPIIIDGKHLGNFFTGQFFLEKPDLEFFRKQAGVYGFDEKEYLKAVEKVPIWTEEKLNQYLDFIKGFIEIIAGIGLKNLKEIESNKAIKQKERELDVSESKFRAVFENSQDAIGVSKKGIIVFLNPAYYKLFGYENEEELVGKSYISQIATQSRNLIQDYIVKRDNGENIPNRYEVVGLRKNGEEFPFEVRVDTFKMDNEKYTISIIRDITRQKQSEEALKESESSLRQSQKIAQMGDWEYDLLTFKLKWSENCYVIFGLKPDEIEPTFDYFKSRVHPDDLHIINEAFENINKDTLPSSAEFRIVFPDGTFRWFQNNMIPIVKEDKLIALKGIQLDITEQKRAESKIAQQALAMESAIDGIAILNADETYIYLNKAHAKIYGYDNADELTGKSWKLLYDDDEIHRFETEIIPLLGKNGFRGTAVGMKKDGSKFPQELSLTALENGGLICVVSDITERKKAEEALKESEYFFKESQKAGNIGSYKTDFIKGYWESSNVLDEIFGIDSYYDRSVQGWLDIVHPDDREMMNTYLIEEVIAKRQPFNKEYRIIRKSDCEVRWVNGIGNVDFDKDGNIISMIGTIQDITESKIAEDLLREQNRQLEIQSEEYTHINEVLRHANFDLKISKEKAEESDRLKSSFLANMSHEIRTPMIGILGFASLLTENDNIDKVKEMAGFIHSSGKRLLETINLILDISRVESGEMKLDIVEIDIVACLKDCIKLFKPNSDLKNLEITFNTDFDELLISSDRNILNSIICNIINNAIKFTEQGSISITIARDVIPAELSSETSVSKEWLRIDITDTGIGIDEKDITNIFKEFRQVSEGKGRSHEGSGLGLTLSKKYVEILGGTIKVKSKLNEGSTFTILLPINKIHNNSKEIEQKLTDSENERINLNLKAVQKKVLVVEDDYVATSFVKILLKGKCIVDESESAADAIEKAKQTQYSVILMDIHLGNSENGIYATKEIRKLPNYSETPIIAMTAYAVKGEREEFLDEGCTDYISKPFEKNKFLNMMYKYLNMG